MWWKLHQQEFPDLARMPRQYLTVPATSAPAERFFSGVGLVQTDTTMIDLMWAKQASYIISKVIKQETPIH
jgi:hypothetical protein